MMQNPEGVSAKFNLESYLKARKTAQKIAMLVAHHIDVGMTEDDGLHIIDELFEMHGVEGIWHPTKFRIGINTTKSFREKSEPNIKLQENDIYYLDIGPVIDGHEADFGQTFTIGQNSEFAYAQKTVRMIFNQLQSYWKTHRPNGIELYQEAQKLALEAGFELDSKMHGHRLGDFPHALYYKGSLSNFESTPIENLWVLELLIRHPSKQFGAFYEDILI
jgi:Xaa-Pro aminopeptidase